MKTSSNDWAVRLIALSLLSITGGQSSSMAASSPVVASQPVGLIQVAINPGANFISAPLHRIHTFRGTVSSPGLDSLTVAGNPVWEADRFAPKDGFTQFIVIVRKSGSANPNHEGEWWPVVANTSNSLSVDNRGEDLQTVLQTGDQIEVRQLTSLKDLFGTGVAFLLNKDSNGIPSVQQEDLIRFAQGTGFSTTIFYHDGTAVGEGYYVNGAGPLDGSTVTVWPDQPMMVFRKSGSPGVTVTCRGQVQVTRLAHYLRPGANVIGNPFAMESPICTSGLIEAGWVGDQNGVPNAAQEDLLRPVQGSGLGAPVFYHDGSVIPAGWYANGTLGNDFPIEPTKGYVLFIKGTESFVWSQPPPYDF